MSFQFSALGNVLENTALFGDILLRLPDITYKVNITNTEYCILQTVQMSVPASRHLIYI